jgi:hypothetical protein
MCMWPIDNNTPFDDVTHWVGRMREGLNETEETDRRVPEQPPIQTPEG